MNDLLELSGTARERGRAHGESLREEIRDRIAKTLNDVSEDDVAPWWHATAASAPTIAEELTGIAEGAGCRLADVVQINVFEALDFAKQADLGAGGCTVIGVRPAEGGPIVAQNWDSNLSSSSALRTQLHRALRPHLHRGPDTLTTLVLASPGGIGWNGINEAGVALVNADLFTKRLRVGVPSKVMRRLILAERSRSEGLRRLRELGGVGGRTYLVGDTTGVDLVEVSAEEPTPIHLPPVGNGWVHTNHAVSSRIALHEDPAKVPVSSRARYTRASELLQQLKGNSSDEIAALLADHHGDPYSVCCHVNEQQPSVTAASVIYDCEQRRASVAIGNPCTAEFRTYQL
ncbi:C45 family autoproteolytic acyltransferase/hydolase [Nocardia sp. NPDC059239]|uniref:C45 family autoproteolytic acyltransferase/hydolase n=1 Tax=Nocardia sp. NPDC059239 TaxID=3346785 RepID=UPI003677DB17